MLIRDAEAWRRGRADVRIEGPTIAAVGRLAPRPDEAVIEARGGALLPGLHDHHLHLAALAAARRSVRCGPPEVVDEAGLARALAIPGDGWLRGVGYHESVAGMLDRATLDRLAPHRPARIQHRSGRMWFLNTPALDLLLRDSPPPPGLERATGRLFDADAWLRQRLGSTPPHFAAVSAELARLGVTGLTDMTPGNDAATAAHFDEQRSTGSLRQRCVLAGSLKLATARFDEDLRLGPAKLHLHEAALPDPAAAVAFATAAHAQERAVAVHCTTRAELVFALSTLAEAGARPGDRIEHAGVTDDALVAELTRLGLQVVTQPHFVAERGDRYLRDVEPVDRPWLYRLGALLRAGLTLAAGSDAPFGSADPWAAMRAAVSRRTAAGAVVGPEEATTPEAALGLYLGDPLDLRRERSLAVGEPADLCLLDRPWAEARRLLAADDVRATIIAGSIAYQRVDQAPVERGARADAAS